MSVSFFLLACATQNVIAYNCGSFEANVNLESASGNYAASDCCNLCYFSPDHLNCNAWQFEGGEDYSGNTCLFWTTQNAAVPGSPAQCPDGVFANQFACESGAGDAYSDIITYGYHANGPCGV
jgi:hypothetical protein